MNKITVEEVKLLDAERAQGDWRLHKFTSRGEEYCNVSFDNEWGRIAGNLYDECGVINENNAEFIAAAPRIAALCIEQAEELSGMSNIIAGLNQRLFEAEKQRDEFWELIGALKSEVEKWKNQARLATEQTERVAESQGELRDMAYNETEQLRAENERLRGGWLPVEECPEDTYVLLYIPNWELTIGKNPLKWPIGKKEGRGDGYVYFPMATHWMPLPLAPTNDKQG